MTSHIIQRNYFSLPSTVALLSNSYVGHFLLHKKREQFESALQTKFTLKLISFYNWPNLKGSALWVTFWDVFQGSVSSYPKHRRLPRKYGTLRRSEQRRILRLPLWRQRQQQLTADLLGWNRQMLLSKYSGIPYKECLSCLKWTLNLTKLMSFSL